MGNENLMNAYTQLKRINDTDGVIKNQSLRTLSNIRPEIIKQSECLKDECYKRLLVDIYCKVIPFDSDYVHGHVNQMKGDVDAFLTNKNMTGTQYFKSAYDNTKAPLLEFVVRSVENIGKQFIIEAEDAVNQELSNGATVISPVKSDADDTKVQNQLVDITKDLEYETFIDKLQSKTISKVTQDVSDVLDNATSDIGNYAKRLTKQTPEITESVISVAMGYVNYRCMKENVENSFGDEELVGMCIRESALNQLDLVFNFESGRFNNIKSRILSGKGVIINESVVDERLFKDVIQYAKDHDIDLCKTKGNKVFNAKLKEVQEIMDNDPACNKK